MMRIPVPEDSEVSVPDPVLVATDGGVRAGAALELAAAYASLEGCPVEVLSLVDPLPDLPATLPHRDELEQANALRVAQRVQDRIRDSVGLVDWPVHLRPGRPAPAICGMARSREARLIVLGVDPGGSDGNALAVELLHLAEAPVLAGARDGALPRSAVVGIDFRASAPAAAVEAGRVVGRDGVVHLVHVKPALDFPAAGVWGWGPCYDRAAEAVFEEIAGALSEIGVGDVRRHTRAGDAADELMRAAAELDAGLLAVGSAGYVCDGRAVVGRVARRILAEAATAVLATPVAASIGLTSIDSTAPGASPASQCAAGRTPTKQTARASHY